MSEAPQGSSSEAAVQRGVLEKPEAKPGTAVWPQSEGTPPTIAPLSISAPVTIPNTTTVIQLPALLYTLSADLTAATQLWRIIDGSTILVTFSGLPLSNVRIQINVRPVAPSTMVPIYPY